MKIIGQPESYSDILERVFATTLASGLLCTVLLAHASPALRDFLESLSTNADIGPLKGVKALYVLIPLAIAVISRIIRLHDRISDVLRIRFRFDNEQILFRLAEGIGLTLTEPLKSRIRADRITAMYAVFYPYAGAANPVIDRQLVRTSLDNWGWFWVALEASFVAILTLVILVVWGKWSHALLLVVAIIQLCGFMVFQWFECRRSAARQVAAILQDPTRRLSVQNFFTNLVKDQSISSRNTVSAGEPAGGQSTEEVRTTQIQDWDAFVCHASEDKAAVVEPLTAELARRGLKIWYDRAVLRIGDSLRRKIDEGLSNSRYGIVVLSPDFFRKQWPQHELDGLVQREIAGRKVILPVWHNVNREDVMAYSVTLADKLAGSTEAGISQLADQLEIAIRDNRL